MARDYGTRRSGSAKNSGPHQLLVVVVTFLLGYLTATVFDIESVGRWMNAQVLNSEPTKPQATAKPAQAQIPPKPKFEFYTLLANERGPAAAQPKAATPNTATTTAATPTTPTTTVTQQVATTATAAATKQAQPTTQTATAVRVSEGKPLTPTNTAKGAFVVQVAAFKARKDAEQMKGMLTLKGFDVYIVPVSRAGSNWFRVVIGPFPTRQSAQQAQVSIAKTERLKGMVTPVRG